MRFLIGSETTAEKAWVKRECGVEEPQIDSQVKNYMYMLYCPPEVLCSQII